MSSPSTADASAALADADFERLRDWFYRRTGIQFASSKRYFVDKRVRQCMEEAGSSSFSEWFGRIRLGNDRALERSLINRLTVHETYFLREDYQLDCLIESVLPRVLADRGLGSSVRLMSLPCSTGDEPYSLAISLLERWRDIDRVDVELAAMDIDADSVQSARDGVYGARALQRLSAKQRNEWFKPLSGARHQISEDLRGAVNFTVGNVCDTRSMRAYRNYDVIFCRNLLIYFDEVSARQAAENLFGMLRPGGWLFLGHSESMSRISNIFEPVRFKDAIAYRRPLED